MCAAVLICPPEHVLHNQTKHSTAEREKTWERKKRVKDIAVKELTQQCLNHGKEMYIQHNQLTTPHCT